jgi:hypothetical protein
MVPIISIILAIALPIFAICRGVKNGCLKRAYLYAIASFVCCAGGIINQIFKIKQRLFAGDIGGIEDTIGAVLIISIASLVIVVILNFLLMNAMNEKE